MTIRIVLPEGNDVRACHGTRVFTADGAEIKNITSIQIDINPNCVIEATLTIAVAEVVGLDGVLPSISKETHDQLEALGYKVER